MGLDLYRYSVDCFVSLFWRLVNGMAEDDLVIEYQIICPHEFAFAKFTAEIRILALVINADVLCFIGCCSWPFGIVEIDSKPIIRYGKMRCVTIGFAGRV